MGRPEVEDGPEFHCPGRESMEIWATHHLKKIQKVVKMATKKMICEIMDWKIVTIVILAVAMMMASQGITKAFEILVKIVAIVLFWQGLKILVQISAVAQSIMGVLSRGEFGDACLGGMQIQRLTQICGKLTIMEHRIMTVMADWWEFVRIFKEVEWL